MEKWLHADFPYKFQKKTQTQHTAAHMYLANGV